MPPDNESFELSYPLSPIGNCPVQSVITWSSATGGCFVLTNYGASLAVFKHVEERWELLFEFVASGLVKKCYQIEKGNGMVQLLLHVDQGMVIGNLDLNEKKFSILGEKKCQLEVCEFGRFYSNPEEVGAATVDSEGKVQFYKFVTKATNRKQTSNPILWLKNSFYQFTLSDFGNLKGIFIRPLSAENNQEYVILSDSKGKIGVFSFDPSYHLTFVFQINVETSVIHCLKSGTKFRDIIVSESNGLALYTFQNANYVRSEYLSHLGQLKSDLYNAESSKIVATTSQGIVYINTDEWRSCLRLSNLVIQERCGLVVGALKLPGSAVSILLKVKGQLFSANVVKTHKMRSTLKKSVQFEEKLPENCKQIQIPLSKKTLPSPKTLLLSDIITVKSFSNCVDVRTGKLSFVLPLVQICNPTGVDLVQSLIYCQPKDSRMDDSFGVLGCGWQLEINCIFMQEDSLFGRRQYGWRRNGIVVRLVAYEGEENLQLFEVPGSEEPLKAEYRPGNEEWIIEGKCFRYRFGKKGALQRSVRHREWFAETVVDSNGLKDLVVAWYLTEISTEKYLQKMTYETEETVIGKHVFNNAIHLTSIRDSCNNKVDFSYASKQKGECSSRVFDLQNHPFCSPFSSKFLQQLSVCSPQFKNTFKFQYEVVDSNRYLKSIEQDEERLAFSYGSASAETRNLKEIVLPDGSLFGFEYDQLDHLFDELPAKEVTAEVNPTVSFTRSFVLLTYIEFLGSQLMLELYDRDMRRIVQKLRVGQQKIATYQVVVDETNILAALVHESGMKQIHHFRLEIGDGKWHRNTLKYSMNNDDVFKFGNNFLVVYSHSEIKCLYRWSDQSYHNEQLPEVLRTGKDICLTTSNEAFLVCNDQKLWLIRFSLRNSLKCHLLLDNLPLERSMDAIDVLDCSDDQRSILKRTLQTSCVYAFNNVIAVTGVALYETSFELNICLNHFDEQFKVVKQANLKQFITKFEEQLVLENLTIDTKAFVENEKIKISLQDLPKNRNPTEDQIRVCYDELLRLFGMKINSGAFKLSRTSDGFRCGQLEYRYDGQRWFSLIFKQSIQLTNHLRIHENENFLNLLSSNGVCLHQLHLPELRNFLPTDYFIAYQTENELKCIIWGSNSKNYQIIDLPSNESLLSVTDQQLVTLRHTDNADESYKNILTFRNVALQQQTLDCRVLIRSSLHTDDTIFRNDYYYSQPTIDPLAGLLFNQTCKTPQSGEGYGWVKYSSSDGAESEEYYDEDGKMVYNSRSRSVSTTTNTTSSVLCGRNGRLEIVDCSPYRGQDGQVIYHGFEEYEVMPGGWKYSSGTIVRDEFAATGRSYLRIEKGGYLSGRVRAEPCAVSFRFVCLMRCSIEAFEIGTELSAVQFEVNGKTTHATPIKKLKDWLLVRIDVQDVEDHAEISFKVVSRASIDVDFFWCAPADFNLKAKIYDDLTGNLTGEIAANGQMKRYFYNVCGRQSLITDFERNLGSMIVFSSKFNSHGLRMKVQIDPMDGFLESFSGIDVALHWKLSDISNVEVRSYRLLHSGNQPTEMKLLQSDLLKSSFAIGCSFDLEKESKVCVAIGELGLTIRRMKADVSELVFLSDPMCVKSIGSLLVCSFQDRILVFIDGEILIDSCTPSTVDNRSISFTFIGQLELNNLFVASKPLLRVQYLDQTELLIQELKITSENEIDVQETVYDAIRRPTHRTVWTRIPVDPNAPLIRFYDEFVSNIDQNGMSGMVSDLNPSHEGYPFFKYDYENAPTTRRIRTGLPGKFHRANGPFAAESLLKRNECADILERLFPSEGGFDKVAFRDATDVVKTRVLDSRGNKVAEYVKAMGTNHQLTTYEFDERNNLVAKLTPKYHEQAQTFLRLEPWKFDEADLVQRRWSVRYSYDSNGKLTEESGPDKGSIKYHYDNGRLVRKEHLGTVICYGYNSVGEINHQHCDGVSRQMEVVHKEGKTIRKITSDGLVEMRMFDVCGLLIEQRDELGGKEMGSMRYFYNKEKVSKIFYPKESQLQLIRTYDPHGNLIGIGVATDRFRFIQNIFNASGLLVKQLHKANDGQVFEREFKYSEALYPTGIDDPFFAQTISYGENSYGGLEYGGRKMNAVEFRAKWVNQCDSEVFKLQKSSLISSEISKLQAETYYQILQQKEVIDKNGNVVKSFYPLKFSDIPTSMVEETSVQKALNQVFTNRWGYRCDYGNHDELLRAKYYQTGDAGFSLKPLTIRSFVDIAEIEKTQCEDLWNELVEGEFIIVDDVHGHLDSSHGKRGVSLLDENIKCLLIDSREENACYFRRVENLILYSIANSIELTEDMFIQHFQKWHIPMNSESFAESLIPLAKDIWRLLSSHRWIGTDSDCSLGALSPKFRKHLANFSGHWRAIVKILHESFVQSLGTIPGDVESYEIDANGNHGSFKAGSRWYDFKYEPYSNRIQSVLIQDYVERGPYRMSYDENGNVTEAMHKNICKITYDKLVNRASQFDMSDGAVVNIKYNFSGERIQKCVKYPDGTSTERYYMRNNEGQCLADYYTLLSDSGETIDKFATFYIYDDHRLIGFYREAKYFNVLTDHEGSIRVVLLDGRVVAAYDFMPYGQILRQYEADQRSGCIFLFTGQEFDRELGLYNYHARLYDPDIGRFLQVDPLEQYASPYKYAGNSPLDMVDPDGRFAFLIPLTILGTAYLGGLIYNSNAKPWEWDWKDSGTWFSVIGGGALGGVTAGILGLAGTGVILGAYLGGASSEKNWFPRQWEWSKMTWFGVFAGGAAGALLPFTWSTLVKSTAASQSTMAFTIFGAVIYAGGNYTVNWIKFKSPNPLDWDWSKPGIYFRLFAGLTMAFNFANSAYSCYNYLSQMNGVVNFFGVVEVAPQSWVTQLEFSAESLVQAQTLLQQAFPHAVKAAGFVVAFMK
ncbi:uncharacterized protein LOC129758364 [Uranotaenia lowii]|uniref:uncharacterized protein LOC129758364 n=1 Tax=Uranotaenia lowii TaxID=190385 RepID=UPI00247B1670|nr:uncharacterized protein LOC129758364 [Uranotaenia lowii]